MQFRAYTEGNCGDQLVGVVAGIVHSGYEAGMEVCEARIEVYLGVVALYLVAEYQRKAKPPEWKAYKAAMDKQRREQGNGQA